MEKKKIDLQDLFYDIQNVMDSNLSANRTSIPHPTAKGDASELNWIKWLKTYLPERYKVDKAFVLDSEGNISEYIDLVIYDRQYSPRLFDKDGTIYIPAESVYGIFEIKQTIDKGYIEYAGKKIASVRNLKRTSDKIYHAGGIIHDPKEPNKIIGGILALECEWSPPFGESFHDIIFSLEESQRIDLGCSIKKGAFEVDYDEKIISKSTEINALISFFMHLVYSLQKLGTVPAIVFSKYYQVLDKTKDDGLSDE